MSGCLANPTPNTGYEPNFYSYMNLEQTPINVPDSHRSSQCRDDATIISATEDPEVFPYSGTSSSSKQTAASRVPPMIGSSGASLLKQRLESIDSRASIQATGANVDRGSVVPTVFSSQSKGKRDRETELKWTAFRAFEFSIVWDEKQPGALLDICETIGLMLLNRDASKRWTAFLRYELQLLCSKLRWSALIDAQE